MFGGPAPAALTLVTDEAADVLGGHPSQIRYTALRAVVQKALGQLLIALDRADDQMPPIEQVAAIVLKQSTGRWGRYRGDLLRHHADRAQVGQQRHQRLQR